jgi:ribonuclease P protein component
MATIARAITGWRRHEIGELLKKARRVFKDAAFEVRLAPTHQYPGRVLIITPAKIGTAPQRNLFRRRVKAIFYGEQLYTKGYNWVIFAYKEAPSVPFQELKRRLIMLVPTR